MGMSVFARGSVIFLVFLSCSAQVRDEDYDEWLVEVAGETISAKDVREMAELHGLEFVRSISDHYLPEYFHLRAEKGAMDISSVTRSLRQNEMVVDVQFQRPHDVEMKSFRDDEESKGRTAYYPSPHCRCHINTASGDKLISSDVFTTMNNKRVNLSERYRFNDYRWPCQWQLYNCGQSHSPDEYDLDVVHVWNKGITGKGMVVAIVDDGVDYRHPEIWPNYDPNASFDFVQFPDHDGPLPYSTRPHGTECAGAVGMVANNRFCGVGVVHDAKIGALRFIGHKSTDVREAASLSFKNNYIDVYSNSWGPTDSGKLGRNGKGNIYPFASGNGGLKNDHCGVDGFTCSIYTLGIASSTRNGRSAEYSEQCTCIMLTIPSTDPHKLYGEVEWMVVPSLFNRCINSFRGTSSATPLASSIFTMVLQANPNLTWRDVQYLVAHTALVVDPNSKQWQINGAGYHINPYFGFGALNALHIVEAAETWKNVDEQHRCLLSYPKPYRVIPSGGKLILPARTDGCVNKPGQVLKLEHIQVILSYKVKCRGDISVKITSPCGTVSPLLNTRKLDDLTDVIDFPFMSVFHWGEDPRGVWTLEITDNKGTVRSCVRSNADKSAGHMWKYELVLWGVKETSRRNMKSPVCDKKNVYDYFSQAKRKDPHFSTLINKEARKSTKNIIHDEFIEDFSQSVEKYDIKHLYRRPPGSKKKRPFSIAYQKIAMTIWRNTFRSAKEKSMSLADYLTNGVSPDSQVINARLFEAVRHSIAASLKREAELTNDDGDAVIRDDMLNLAKLLVNERRDSKQLFNSKEDAATILESLSDVWSNKD